MIPAFSSDWAAKKLNKCWTKVGHFLIFSKSQKIWGGIPGYRIPEYESDDVPLLISSYRPYYVTYISTLNPEEPFFIQDSPLPQHCCDKRGWCCLPFLHFLRCITTISLDGKTPTRASLIGVLRLYLGRWEGWMIRMSRSLSSVASPLAYEPKRMILSGWVTSSIRRTISFSSSSSTFVGYFCISYPLSLTLSH